MRPAQRGPVQQSLAVALGVVAVLLLVIWLSSLMAEGGVMRDLVEAVRSRVPKRLAFAALPAAGVARRLSRAPEGRSRSPAGTKTGGTTCRHRRRQPCGPGMLFRAAA